jgi:hypothetical protein
MPRAKRAIIFTILLGLLFFATSANAATKCSYTKWSSEHQGSFAWSGYDMPYEINSSSVPSQVGPYSDRRYDVAAVIARIKNGARSWNITRNKCHFRANETGVNLHLTTSDSSIANEKMDGHSVVMFKSSDQCFTHTTLECTAWWPRQNGGPGIGEFDILINSRYPYWTGLRSMPSNKTDYFDLFGLAVHEFGHGMGIAHTPSPSSPSPDYVKQQVMFREFGHNDITKRYLGGSDYTALCTLESCGH